MDVKLIKQILDSDKVSDTTPITLKEIKDICDHNGTEKSLNVVQEECAELIVEVSHLRRPEKKDEDENAKLYEEVADVYNALDYLRHIYTLDYHKIEAIRRAKINKALGREDPILGPEFLKVIPDKDIIEKEYGNLIIRVYKAHKEIMITLKKDFVEKDEDERFFINYEIYNIELELFLKMFEGVNFDTTAAFYYLKELYEACKICPIALPDKVLLKNPFFLKIELILSNLVRVHLYRSDKKEYGRVIDIALEKENIYENIEFIFKKANDPTLNKNVFFCFLIEYCKRGPVSFSLEDAYEGKME